MPKDYARCELVLQNDRLDKNFITNALKFCLKINIRTALPRLYLLTNKVYCFSAASTVCKFLIYGTARSTEYEGCMLRSFLFVLTGFSKHSGVRLHSCYGMKYIVLHHWYFIIHTWILSRYWHSLAINYTIK